MVPVERVQQLNSKPVRPGRFAARVACRAVQVETDVVVPVEVASDHAAYAARTLRPKLRRLWPPTLVPFRTPPVRRDSLDLNLGGEDLSDIDSPLASLAVDRTVGHLRHFTGGARRARRLLKRFIADKLADYADRRDDPSLDIQSHISPYLHFGQIGPLEVALAVRARRRPLNFPPKELPTPSPTRILIPETS